MNYCLSAMAHHVCKLASGHTGLCTCECGTYWTKEKP